MVGCVVGRIPRVVAFLVLTFAPPVALGHVLVVDDAPLPALVLFSLASLGWVVLVLIVTSGVTPDEAGD